MKRETFDASVYFVAELFQEIGHSEEKALDLIEKFKTHDEIMLNEQFKVRKDDKMFVSVSKQATAQFHEVLEKDNSQSYIEIGQPK